MPKAIEGGFQKADPRNLPEVTAEMVAEFFKGQQFLVPEVKNVKTINSMRLGYRDKAIGYVRVNRDGSKAHIIADVTPEHRIHSKGYKVHCIVDTEQKAILESYCDDCAASKGGCKHAVVLVAWLYHESKEPSVTEKACYWKKSKLAECASMEAMTVEEVSPHPQAHVEEADVSAFFEATVADLTAAKSDAMLLRHLTEQRSLSMFHILTLYKRANGPRIALQFVRFCKQHMSVKDILEAAILTEKQSKSSLWYALRQFRVSASKLHEASACQTPDGCCARSIKGAVKLRDTEAMARGRDLESFVVTLVEKHFGKKCSSTGVVLSREYPVFAASPDAIMGDAVIEIKCPTSMDRMKTYFTKDCLQPAPRYKAQVQLQLLMCDKKVGYFCVADPNVEKNHEVSILKVQYDEVYIKDVMAKAFKFWAEFIFPDMYDKI